MTSISLKTTNPLPVAHLCWSVLLSMVRTASPIEAGILRPGFYEAPGFGRDDAPLRLNILAFYFRPLGWRETPTNWVESFAQDSGKRLSNCQHRRSQGSWHDWDEYICHFDAFFRFIGIIGIEVVHICGTCLMSWGFNSFKGPPTGKLITQCCTTLWWIWDCSTIMFVIPC